MLTRAEIESLQIIQESDQAFYDKTSYNLRVGDEYVHIDFNKNEIRSFSQLGENACLGITIPPFGCILLSTKEWLCVPNGVYGRWGLKIRPALSGLIFQAGPQIEPGYVGRLFGLLYNLSAKERRLLPDEKLWSIDFTRVSYNNRVKLVANKGALTDGKISSYITKHSMPSGGPSEVLSLITSEIRNLTDLSEKIKSDEDKLHKELSALSDNLSNRLTQQRLEDKETIIKDLLKQNNDAANQNRELLSELTRKRSWWQEYLLGFILIIVCAMVPLIISKTMYDKDEFVNLVEGRSTIQALEKTIEEKINNNEQAMRALIVQVNSITAQLDDQHKINTKSPSKSDHRNTNNHSTRKSDQPHKE